MRGIGYPDLVSDQARSITDRRISLGSRWRNQMSSFFSSFCRVEMVGARFDRSSGMKQGVGRLDQIVMIAPVTLGVRVPKYEFRMAK